MYFCAIDAKHHSYSQLITKLSNLKQNMGYIYIYVARSCSQHLKGFSFNHRLINVSNEKLNASICCERHIIQSVEETHAQLGDAIILSKLDANTGFWQIKLASESALLTTFITPFGHYSFKQLPFGISSAPKIFQRRMSEILNGIKGTVCMMDDVLVFGKDKEEHNKRLN